MDELPLRTLWTCTASTDGGEPAPEPPPEVPLPDGPRYIQRKMIGRGGMGEVWRVHDTLLSRDLVRKDLRPELAGNHSAVRQFTNEARITAFLQHPGVVPVLDIGILEDGRPFYTMQEVRGPRLTESILLARRERGGWTLRRLVEAIRRVTEVLALAHQRGVLHRDLKPDNVMVGEFGEVLVLDWGIARAQPPVGREEFPGQIVGTLSYMAPEMARGELDAVGPPSDVFQLGGLLHEALCGRPPRRGAHATMRARAGSEPIPPLPADTDPDLAEICRRALAFDPADRYPEAAPMAAALRDWLDGRQRRERALSVVEEAQRHRAQAAALAAEAGALHTEARAILDPVRTYDPDHRKKPGWRLEDRARETQAMASLAADHEEQALQAALRIDPELPEAHGALADLYRTRHAAAERSGDRLDAARLEQRLRAHNRGAHDGYLRGAGAVTLVTDPPGAEVMLHRFEPIDRRLEPVPVRSLGRTPLHALPLPIGSYLMEIRHPERATVRYPVRVEREVHWDGIPPGETEPMPIHLPRPGELTEDDCYVPAGPFLSGGDPEAIDSLSSRTLWVDGFVIRRDPVTNREYLAYLNQLLADGLDPDAFLPVGLSEEATLFGRQRDRFVLGADSEGRRLRPSEPVVFVSMEQCDAYVAWRSKTDGLPWRLPHGQEREKAGRGVDGRFFPWGDHFEPTWTRMVNSLAQAPARARVETLSDDISPYGVRGTAGNVRDLCGNGYRRDGAIGERVVPTLAGPEEPYRIGRGGGWTNKTIGCRLAGRLVAQPGQRSSVMGMRLARSLPYSDGG